MAKKVLKRAQKGGKSIDTQYTGVKKYAVQHTPSRFTREDAGMGRTWYKDKKTGNSVSVRNWQSGGVTPTVKKVAKTLVSKTTKTLAKKLSSNPARAMKKYLK